jgi:small nuclear ribonucleoprotein (snRNP)-like protein
MDGAPFAIQGYGPFEQERIVPLGLNSHYQTVVTLELDSTENMDVEDIILEDRYYGIYHDLRVTPYVFQSAPMLYSDRFFLHFAPQMVTGVSSSTVAPEMQAFVASDMLNLRSNSRITGTLQMFDMSGKMVLETSNVSLGSELLKVDVSHLAKGVYSVRIQDSKKAHVQKVIK